MPSHLPLLPIEPASPDLRSHLDAFDTLIAQLESLPRQTRWPTQLRINSKARILGSVIHTNDIKVCLGDVWWVEMTAQEGVEYVKRKKMALLAYHVRGVRSSSSSPSTPVQPVEPWPLPPAISFNPLFRHPVGAEADIPDPSASIHGSERQPAKSEPHGTTSVHAAGSLETQPVRIDKSPAASTAAGESPKPVVPTIPSSQPSPPLRPPHAPIQSSPLNPHSAPTSSKQALNAPKSTTVKTPSDAAASTPTPPTPQAQQTADALADLLSKFVDTGKLQEQGAKIDDTPAVNEDGLPIHEIRETLDGNVIGQVPNTSREPLAAGGKDMEDELRDKDKAYWSKDAVDRRRLLWEKVFGGAGSDEDDENDEDESDDMDQDGNDTDRQSRSRHDDSASEDEEDKTSILPASISTRTATPSVNVQSATPTSPRRHSPPPPSALSSGTSSGSATPVIPLSEPSSLGHGNPSSNTVTPSRRPSATLPPPTKSILKAPARKKSVSFDESVPAPPESPVLLNDKGKGEMSMSLPQPIKVGGDSEGFGDKQVPVIPVPVPKGQERPNGFAGFKKGFLNGASNSNKSVASTSDGLETRAAPRPTENTKKPSLFAQRMAQKTVVESSTSSQPPTAPSLAPRTPDVAPKPAFPKMSESVGTSSVKGQVVERAPIAKAVPTGDPHTEIANWTPLSQLPINAPSGYTPTEPSAQPNPNGVATEQEDEEDYSDDLEFDTEEEDEYDLDEALLAREMALEYHRRRAFTAPRPSGSDDEDADGGDPDAIDITDGSVMLALPQVEGGDGPQIVNPTPDDWRRFVRVGRLENGNLVLAPGQEGWDDEEAQDDQDRNVEPAETSTPPSQLQPAKAKAKSTVPELSAEEKKANVERMKRVILGLEPDLPPSTSATSSTALDEVQLPPTLMATMPAAARSTGAEDRVANPPASVGPKVTKGVGEIVERSSPAEPSTPTPLVNAPVKKVSKFKAARMGA